MPQNTCTRRPINLDALRNGLKAQLNGTVAYLESCLLGPDPRVEWK